MRKVLVTGGTGLIGSETIPLLADYGFETYVLTKKPRDHALNVKYVEGNLFDKNRISSILSKIKPEYLLHFAWLSTGLFDDNLNFDFLTSSIDLLKSFNENGGKRVVMAGTYAEYGYSDEILDERLETKPINTYGQCKDFTHKIAEIYCKRNDISFGWGRIFSVYGKEKDSRRLTADVINHLKQDRQIVIHSGSLMRDYIYVKDVANAFVKFLDSNIEGSVNICSGIGVTIHDYVMAIAKIMGKEDLVIFDEIESSQQKKVVGNPFRLNKEIKFIPQYSLENGIRDILLNY